MKCRRSRKKNRVRLYPLISLFLLAAACFSDSGALENGSPGREPVAGGDRLLGLHVDAAQGEEFDRAVRYARGLGIDFTVVTLKWNMFEKTPGRIEDPDRLLEIIDYYYPRQGLKVFLELASPVNTTVRNMPDDLSLKGFDDPAVLSRFARLLEFVIARLGAIEFTGFVIGNEVDIYLRQHPEEAAAFTVFFRNAAATLRNLKPGLAVGVTTTLEGALDGLPPGAARLLSLGDFISVTYYPLDPDYTVKDPAAVRDDFARLCGRHPAARIFFQECGFPTAAVCRSGEDLQARFYEAVFRAWDEFRSRIKLIAFYELTDWPPEAVAEYLAEIRTAESPALAGFIRTLGIRGYEDGRPKKAARVFQEAAQVRGWRGLRDDDGDEQARP